MSAMNFGMTRMGIPDFATDGRPMLGGAPSGFGPMGARPGVPLGGIPGSSVMDTGEDNADKGQLAVAWELITVKDVTAAHAAGISPGMLVFVHRPVAAPAVTNRDLYRALSLTDLNKLLFLDAVRARGGERSEYHNFDQTATFHTAHDIMMQWSLLGTCMAVDGLDASDRAISNRQTVSHVAGGWALALNYWGVRRSNCHLYLVLKLVEVLQDPLRGDAVRQGAYRDTCKAALKQQSHARDLIASEGRFFGAVDAAARVAAVAERGVALDAAPLNREDFVRRRMQAGANRVARAGYDPMMAWQFTAWFSEMNDVPSEMEYTGSWIDADGHTHEWVGAVVHVGSSGFADSQGANPLPSERQFDAANRLLHVFDRSEGGASIASISGAIAVTRMIHIFMNM